MVNMNEGFIDSHKDYYSDLREQQNRGRISVPGSQYLVHLFRGGYLGDDLKNGLGRRALDVGCGSGYNAVTLSMLGWNVSATEITQDIVEHAQKTVLPYGEKIDFHIGENESLPFPDSEFDLLISMNVIHYCNSSAAVKRTVEEYARCLKSGGLILLLTHHPENWLIKDGRHLDDNMIEVCRDGDYRSGQHLFLFEDLNHLERQFSTHFYNVRTGLNVTEFFNRTLKHQVMVAQCR